jgi:hypothetical protein
MAGLIERKSLKLLAQAGQVLNQICFFCDGFEVEYWRWPCC